MFHETLRVWTESKRPLTPVQSLFTRDRAHSGVDFNFHMLHYPRAEKTPVAPVDLTAILQYLEGPRGPTIRISLSRPTGEGGTMAWNLSSFDARLKQSHIESGPRLGFLARAIRRFFGPHLEPVTSTSVLSSEDAHAFKASFAARFGNGEHMARGVSKSNPQTRALEVKARRAILAWLTS
ncbi:MAG: hypothetical protein Q8P02_01460 [Candidatus Micrarchaeota archaeon]|nr:hypothetical protein [Candidatus Micrarchaeota archaeon]